MSQHYFQTLVSIVAAQMIDMTTTEPPETSYIPSTSTQKPFSTMTPPTEPTTVVMDSTSVVMDSTSVIMDSTSVIMDSTMHLTIPTMTPDLQSAALILYDFQHVCVKLLVYLFDKHVYACFVDKYEQTVTL